MNLNKQVQRGAGRSVPSWLSAPFAWAQPSAPPEASTVDFDLALQHLERCQWSQAFQRLTVLADAGHGPSARIALLMHDHGARFFGGRYLAEASRRERWLDVAATQAPVGDA